MKDDPFQNPTLDGLWALKQRLLAIHAKAWETEAAKMIVDNVEHLLQTDQADSVRTLAMKIEWSDCSERRRTRLVRVALAIIGATYDREDFVFRWRNHSISPE